MLPYSLINATGSIVISAVTLISALYLFIMLYRQEKGKLRVRLLVGMVISDLLLGWVNPLGMDILVRHTMNELTILCHQPRYITTSRHVYSQ